MKNGESREIGIIEYKTQSEDKQNKDIKLITLLKNENASNKDQKKKKNNKTTTIKKWLTQVVSKGWTLSYNNTVVLLNIKCGKSHVGNRAMKLTYVKISFLESKSDLLLCIERVCLNFARCTHCFRYLQIVSSALSFWFSLTLMRTGIIPQEEQQYQVVHAICMYNTFKSHALVW